MCTRLPAKAKKHNDKMQSKISSEESIRGFGMQLDSLSKPGLLQRGYDYVTGGSYWIDCHREYQHKRAWLNSEVLAIASDATKELKAENYVLLGKFLAMTFYIRDHLGNHLEPSAMFRMKELARASREYLDAKLQHLLSLLKGLDARSAIAQLGSLLAM